MQFRFFKETRLRENIQSHFSTNQNFSLKSFCPCTLHMIRYKTSHNSNILYFYGILSKTNSDLTYYEFRHSNPILRVFFSFYYRNTKKASLSTPQNKTIRRLPNSDRGEQKLFLWRSFEWRLTYLLGGGEGGDIPGSPRIRSGV